MFKSILLTILLVSIFLVSIFSLQKSNFKEDKKELTQVCLIPDTDKDTLFKRCLLWTAKNYRNTMLTKYDIDQGTGVIRVSCVDSFGGNLVKYYCFYSIVISVKDGTLEVQYPVIDGYRSGIFFVNSLKYEKAWKPIKARLKANSVNLFEVVKIGAPIEW